MSKCTSSKIKSQKFLFKEKLLKNFRPQNILAIWYNPDSYIRTSYSEPFVAGIAPQMVTNVVVDNSAIIINGNNVTLTLSWEVPFNNFDPIVNYTVSCSGHVMGPLNFTTIDNTTRSHTFTNLTLKTNYTFSVVATNSFGSGEAGVVMITTPSKVIYVHELFC